MLLELTTEEIEVIRYVLDIARGESWLGDGRINKRATFSLMGKVAYPLVEEYADWGEMAIDSAVGESLGPSEVVEAENWKPGDPSIEVKPGEFITVNWDARAGQEEILHGRIFEEFKAQFPGVQE